MKSIISGAFIATAIVACLTTDIQAKSLKPTATIALSDTGKMDKMKMDKMKMDKKKMAADKKMSKDKMKMDKMKMAKDSSKGKM